MSTATLVRERPEIVEALKPRLTPYIPHVPTPKQQAYLWLTVREALYGGAAGGGKSDALLMASLQYVDVPGYAALILRRSFQDLSKPGALIPRAEEWLARTDAKWIPGTHTWLFPTGGQAPASLTFGYLKREEDTRQYQGAEFQFVGFDEVTQFWESAYRYLFSRLRRPKGNTHLSRVPLRMRCAGNPGDIGHKWVMQRFMIDAPPLNQNGLPERVFIPATMLDNPHLDIEEYRQSLAELDPVTRAQLERGDWMIRKPGGLFDRSWVEVVEPADVPPIRRRVRYWDLAATEPSDENPDPDFTAGLLMADAADGLTYIMDVRHLRKAPGGVEAEIKATAGVDGRATMIRIEQEPGASGKSTIASYARLLRGYDVKGRRDTGSKEERARIVSAAMFNRQIRLVRGPWLTPFLEEIEAFPTKGVHDDQVDALSGAWLELAGGERGAYVF